MTLVKQLTGGCQCGAVRYTISAEPLAMLRCHCTSCQKQSASAFGLSVFVPVTGFAVAGPLKHFEQRAESGRRMRYHFCAECGTRIHHTAEPDPQYVSVKGGTLDPGHGLEPVADVWTRSKLPWVPLLEGGLAYPQQPPDMTPILERWQALRTIAFYNHRAADYAERGEDETDHDALKAFAAALPSGAAVLDLGCGSGWAAAALRELGFAVTAMDASAGLAREAARRHGIEVRLGRFEDLEAHERFDGLWVHFSLLHIPRTRWPDLLARMRRALRPGGRLHIGLKAGEGSGPDRLGRFYSYATRAELAALLTEAGFVDIEIEQRSGSKGFDGSESDILLAVARRGD